MDRNVSQYNTYNDIYYALKVVHCSLVSYELRLSCRDLVCVCYWVFPSGDGRSAEQGCFVVKRLPLGCPLAVRCVARSPASQQAPGPFRRCLGDVKVSNNVTLF